MNLVLLGPPGAGKGTQAKLLEDAHSLIKLSTGDMLRAAVAADTNLIAERLDEAGAEQGFILDGFPRTIAQAKALDGLFKARHKSLDTVIVMEVDDDALVERITGRFACANCREGYHDVYKPTKVPGVCDRCKGTEFVRRKDDNEEVVRARLKAYHAQTEPLIHYYQLQGKVKSVDGMADIATVQQEIDRALAGEAA
jgi:adenylate kinase